MSSEQRPQGTNGSTGRDTRTAAERETARTEKVTAESSVLRNDPHAAEHQERSAENRQGGARAAAGRTAGEGSVAGEYEHTGYHPRGLEDFGRDGTEGGAGGRTMGRDGDSDWRERESRHRADEWREDERRRRPEAPARTQPSVGTLLRALASDAADLTRKELALARGEISHSISELKAGIIGIAAGGGVLFAGFLFLLLAATLGLATVMPGWAAALIVGGVVALIGLVMVMTGQRRMRAEHFRPDRTVEAMRKDREMLERRVQ